MKEKMDIEKDIRKISSENKNKQGNNKTFSGHSLNINPPSPYIQYSPEMYILLFFTFAFIGWVWEVMIHIFRDGMFVNRGVMIGPWLPIYEFGGVMILFLLKKVRYSPVKTFFYSMLVCSVVEYVTSWFLEKIFHTRWWDYSQYFLNLNGRIFLLGTIFFGLAGCGFVYFMGPIFNQLYKRIGLKIQVLLCVVLICFLSVDTVHSFFEPNTGKGINDYSGYQVSASLDNDGGSGNIIF